jgi:hypothetical protein
LNEPTRADWITDPMNAYLQAVANDLYRRTLLGSLSMKPADEPISGLIEEPIPALNPYLSADLAMIQRDGPARPAPVLIQEPAKPSAHAPIQGLTFLGRVDHRLGLGR